MWCGILVRPRDRLAGGDRPRRGEEREVRDADAARRRHARLNDDLAMRVSYRDLADLAARYIDDRDVVRALVRDVGEPPVVARGDPVRQFADADHLADGVARGTEHRELVWTLTHGEARLAGAGEVRVVRRGADRDLRHDLVARRVKHHNRVHAGLSEIEGPALRAELERARRLVQRNRAQDGPTLQVNDDERELAELWGSDVGSLAVGMNRAVVRLRDRDAEIGRAH